MAIKNGLYDARAASPSDLRFTIRVDLGRGNQAGVMFRQVSGDMFRTGGSTPMLLDSFQATALDVAPDGDTITAPVSFFGGGGTGTLILTRRDGTVAGTFQTGGTALVSAGAVALELTLTREGFFRELGCQVDLTAGTANPFSGWSEFQGRQMTVQTCLADAGIYLKISPQSETLGGPVLQWTADSLLDAMNAHFASPAGISADVYLLVASAMKDSTNTTGIMFDVKARRGAAVFYNPIRTIYANSGFWKNFIRTTVHEIGHTFNLPHSWESPFLNHGSDIATFMNYPWVYNGSGTGGSPEERYWNQFQYRFSQAEQLRLAHGPLRGVIMGGESYLGQTADQAGGQFGGGEDLDGLKLELHIMPNPLKRIFEFGAPVHVEVRLSNRSSETRPVHDALGPQYSVVTYLIRKPSGQVVRYENLYEESIDFRADGLAPDDTPLYRDACLSYGRDGFIFMEPGRYEVQAIYPARQGFLYSNILDLFVRYPSKEDEDAIVPTLDRDVATYLALGGAWHLDEAEKKLRNFAANYTLKATKSDPASTGKTRRRVPAKGTAAHPLAYAFWRCEARKEARGRIVVNRQTGQATQTKAPAPSQALLFESLGLAKDGTIARANAPAKAGKRVETVAPFSNLINGKLFTQLIPTLDDKVVRKRVFDLAKDYLDRHDVPEPIRKDYHDSWEGTN